MSKSELERECERTPKVTAQVTYGNTWDTSKDKDDWRRRANPWTVQLRYRGRRMTVPFWTGEAISEPSAADVLGCLISDAAACDSSFEDWAGDLGYDTDSRAAELTYRECVKNGERVRKLLGEDWDRFAGKEH